MATDTALQLAESIVVEGFESLDAELVGFLAEARRFDVSPVLIEVAGDRSAPAPVRQRALGRVVVEVCRDMPQPPLPAWVTNGVRRAAAA